ncbi:MAG TPA: hypothetical protein DIW31_11405 [Bacteroidales bacterium]|nr:hypothetical protein [Bacteroidales bacterium]
MSLINYFDHHDKKASKEHFMHLIQVANADGVVDKSESDLLHRVGKRLGFTDPEIDMLIEKRDSKLYTPPFDLEERFHQLYDIVAMALADGIMFTSEVKIFKRLAIASNFNDEDTDRLLNLLVNGIKQNKSEDELFKTFKQKK